MTRRNGNSNGSGGGNCLLGFLIGNLALIAWSLSLDAAGYNALEYYTAAASTVAAATAATPITNETSSSLSTSSSASASASVISFGLLGFSFVQPQTQQQQSQDEDYDVDPNPNQNQNFQRYYLKYTIQQEDVILHATTTTTSSSSSFSSSILSLFPFLLRFGRYLYFLQSVFGLVTSLALLVSFCGKSSWPILSQQLQSQRRVLTWICILLAIVPMWIILILYYDSPICQVIPSLQNNNENDNNIDNSFYHVQLNYIQTKIPNTNNNNDIDMDGTTIPSYQYQYYATTATTTEITYLDHDNDNNDIDNNNDIMNNICAPAMTHQTYGSGAISLLASSILWIFIAFVMICCCHCNNNNNNNTNNTNNKDLTTTTTTTTPTPTVSQEPLFDPATRTLGWIAKLQILTLFATVPYWMQAALIAMAPGDTPFQQQPQNNDAFNNNNIHMHTNNNIPGTQLVGPIMFNPTQQISYSQEQLEWILPAFEWPTKLAWVPFGTTLILALPWVLYGRHQLVKKSGTTQTQPSNNRRSNNPCWPYVLLLMILIQFASAIIGCLGIPIHVMSQLCHDNKRYPELQFEFVGGNSDDGGVMISGEEHYDNSNTNIYNTIFNMNTVTTTNTVVWKGTDIVHHSAMTTKCWPTELGQVYMIGGTILLLLQCILLVVFSIQYSNAKDTLETLHGIEQDYQNYYNKSNNSGGGSTKNTQTTKLLDAQDGDDDDDDDDDNDDIELPQKVFV